MKQRGVPPRIRRPVRPVPQIVADSAAELKRQQRALNEQITAFQRLCGEHDLYADDMLKLLEAPPPADH